MAENSKSAMSSADEWKEVTEQADKLKENMDTLIPTFQSIVSVVESTTGALLGMTGVDFGPLSAGLSAVSTAVSTYSTVTTAINLAKTAQLAFNTAVTANPIGLAAAAITGAVVGMVELTKALDEASLHLSETHERLIANYDAAVAMAEASKKAKAEYQDLSNTWEDQNAQVQLLTKRYGELTGTFNRTAQQELELQSVIDGLNTLIPDLGLEYNQLTKSTNKSAEAVERFATASVADEKYLEVLEKRNEAQANLNAALEQQKQYQTELDQLVAQQEESGTIGGTADEIQLLKNSLEALEPAITNNTELVNAYNSQIGELSTEITDQYMIAAEERQKAIQAEAEQSMVSYESICNAAMDMFSRLSTESDLSVQEMIENLQANQEAVAQWADNLKILAERGVDQGLLQKMQEMGPEAAGYVAEMVNATDEELAEMSRLWSGAANIASDAMIDSIDHKSPEVKGAVQDLIDKSEPNISGFYDAGRDAALGFANGMDAWTSAVESISSRMAGAAVAAARGQLEIYSPSRVFKRIGAYTGEGFEIGFVDSMKEANRAVARAVDKTIGVVNGEVSGSGILSAGNAGFSNALLELKAQREYGAAVMEFAASRSPGSQISNSRSVQYNGGISINVQAAPGMSVNRLVDEIERRLAAATARREAVW